MDEKEAASKERQAVYLSRALRPPRRCSCCYILATLAAFVVLVVVIFVVVVVGEDTGSMTAVAASDTLFLGELSFSSQVSLLVVH